jgi:hypothetical protein
MYNHNNQVNYEGNFRPNAPPIEEEELRYQQPIPQEPTRQMNYSHIKYVVYFLSCFLTLSYIPGFLSVTSQKWQPSLMTSKLYTKTLPYPNPNHNHNHNLGVTLYSGWYSGYLLENESYSKWSDDSDDECNLYKTGRLYISSSIVSLFLLSTLLCFCKSRHFVRFGTMLISWLLLLFVTIIYIVEFVQCIGDIADNADNAGELEYKITIGYGLTYNFLGLLLIPVIHILMYLY